MPKEVSWHWLRSAQTWMPMPASYTNREDGDGQELEKPAAPDVVRMITVNIKHLDILTLDQMDTDDRFWYSFDRYKYDTGWFVYAGDADESLFARIPEDISDCLRYARKYGCEWLRIDKYGPIVPDLELYD